MVADQRTLVAVAALGVMLVTAGKVAGAADALLRLALVVAVAVVAVGALQTKVAPAVVVLEFTAKVPMALLEQLSQAAEAALVVLRAERRLENVLQTAVPTVAAAAVSRVIRAVNAATVRTVQCVLLHPVLHANSRLQTWAQQVLRQVPRCLALLAHTHGLHQLV